MSEDASGCDLLILEKVPSNMLEYALAFIYTDSCDLLENGALPQLLCTQEQSVNLGESQLISSLEELEIQEKDLRGRSALDVYHSLPQSKNRTGRAGKPPPWKRGVKTDKQPPTAVGLGPIKHLQAVAKKLGIGSLSNRLNGVKVESGRIKVVNKPSWQ